jgi:hypothetical protein
LSIETQASLKKVISSWKHCSVPKEMGETSGKNKKKTFHPRLSAVQCRDLGKTKTNLVRPTASLRSR